MKRLIKLAKILAGIAVVWSILTLVVEIKGAESLSILGDESAPKHALIIYDPDPFYNLDEQVCRGFGEGLMDTSRWEVTLATVRAAKKLNSEYDLYVFCANTYNWAPDWAISHFIKKQARLAGKPAVAITLGSGSTGRSQRILVSQIEKAGFCLLDAQTYWLMRPNDESRMDESNVAVAVEAARNLGLEIAGGI